MLVGCVQLLAGHGVRRCRAEGAVGEDGFDGRAAEESGDLEDASGLGDVELAVADIPVAAGVLGDLRGVARVARTAGEVVEEGGVGEREADINDAEAIADGVGEDDAAGGVGVGAARGGGDGRNGGSGGPSETGP